MRAAASLPLALALLLLTLLPLASTAHAVTIPVGPERAVKLPSEALKAAAEGDTIAIDPGEYYDCLRVGTPGLTIEGLGAGAVLTDTVCDGKAIVVAGAERLMLRNLTLQRARVAEGNGAGIRAEGGSLIVDRLRFVNNQAGLIAADMPEAVILVQASRFEATGLCDGPRCAPAISVGKLRRLRIERSVLTGTRGAHQIVSGAAATEITGSTIEDGGQGSASYQLLLPTGGKLRLENNTFQKGRHAANTRAAVLIDGELDGASLIRRNSFINDTGRPVPFIVNWSDGTPALEANSITPPGTEISTDGYLVHRATTALRTIRQAARGVARWMLQ